jgi:hypothetical protein
VIGVEHADAVVVERWCLNETNRAYITVAGKQVGFRDLRTGSVHCADARYLGVLIQNTETMLSAAPTLPSRPVRHERLRSAQRGLLPDRDLAARVHSHHGGDAAATPVAAKDAVAVARRLLALPPGWRGLHAVPVGEDGSDIDHLVIGPGGVFTVNTQHHRHAHVRVRCDTVSVNGRSERYVGAGRLEAQRAARLLTARAGFKVPVRAVVAIAGARGGFDVEAQPPDGSVVVLLLKSLAPYLRSLPVVMDDDEVEWLHDVARHLATWQPSTVGWTEFRGCSTAPRRTPQRGRGRLADVRHRRGQLTSR